MNPFDVFLAFRPRGLGTALIEAFAAIKTLSADDPKAALVALRAIALSLPPTQEWSGLVRELVALIQPGPSSSPLRLSDEQLAEAKARLAALHRRAAGAPADWNDELEAELEALMSSLSRR